MGVHETGFLPKHRFFKKVHAPELQQQFYPEEKLTFANVLLLVKSRFVNIANAIDLN